MKNGPDVDGLFQIGDLELRSWARAASDWTRSRQVATLTTVAFAATMPGHTAMWPVIRTIWKQSRCTMGDLETRLEQYAADELDRAAGFVPRASPKPLALSRELQCIWSRFRQIHPDPCDRFFGIEALDFWALLLDEPKRHFATVLEKAGLNLASIRESIDFLRREPNRDEIAEAYIKAQHCFGPKNERPPNDP